MQARETLNAKYITGLSNTCRVLNFCDDLFKEGIGLQTIFLTLAHTRKLYRCSFLI